MSDARSGCAYCGLPASPAPAGEPAYCCYGCRLAAQITGATADDGDRFLLVRLGLAVFFAMNVMAFTMTLWTQEVYGDDEPHRLAAPMLGLFRWLACIFSLPVFYLLGVPLAENAWEQAQRRVFSTDLLLLLGVAASFAVSLPATQRGDGPVYYEVGVAVLVFVTLGRWLEARGKRQATESLDALEKLLPETIERRGPEGVASAPLDAVVAGDVLIVRAGQRIACDGVVLERPGSVDEHLWTGESAGRTKEPGDAVWAGSLNLAGDLVVRVEAPPREGALRRLGDLMRAARLAQGPYERMADRLSRAFLPLVVLLALAAFALHGWRSGLDRGVLAGLAVVVIACPCALGIATPLAVWAALGTAARRGVLFRSGDVLERCAGVRAFAFDKTGTLTEGTSRVVREAVSDEAARERAAALAAASTHVFSRALRERLGPAPVDVPVTTLPGRGLEATWPNGEVVWLGSAKLFAEMNQTEPGPLTAFAQAAHERGNSLVGVAWGGAVRAWFELEESLRPSAGPALAALTASGLATCVLTGDHRRRGDALAAQLGTSVASELLPADKWTRLADLRAAHGPIAMVGDGINDAPALAAADVGIALGCGADVARASAGVCLMGNDLGLIPWSWSLARRTTRVARTNLFWALAYNVAGIGLALAGALNPVWASLAMVVSSLLVVGNSLRLTR